MLKCNIVLLPGDGNGPGLIECATTVLSAIGNRYGILFNLIEKPIGGQALDTTGVPLPEETIQACQKADGVILGAVGGDKWNDIKSHNRPERAIRALYTAMSVQACIYPISPLLRWIKESPNTKKSDIMLVRAAIGGTDRGDHGYRDGALGQEGFDTIVYSISEAENLTRIATELASARQSSLTVVDKADALDSSKLWRATAERIAKASGVTLTCETAEAFITNAIKDPESYGVVLAPNILGSILVPVLSAIPGGVGLMPMCALGATNIYGGVQIQGVSHDNPIGTIMSTAMMLSSLNLVREAAAIERVVKQVLSKGLRTADITAGKKYISGKRMAEEIADMILYS